MVHFNSALSLQFKKKKKQFTAGIVKPDQFFCLFHKNAFLIGQHKLHLIFIPIIVCH